MKTAKLAKASGGLLDGIRDSLRELDRRYGN
jgi:hypothetical protein